MRLIVDTDVVIAAVRSRTGAAAALLAMLLARRGSILISVALALEYESVARDAKHVRASGLAEVDVVAFIDALILASEPVAMNFRYRPQLRDPGDEMVLEAAINGRADAIVTFNVRDYHYNLREIPADFGIDVLNPKTALTRLRAIT
jgi:putative PIN family toxin of toxin-antitoxin system